MNHPHKPATVDISERGAPIDGSPQISDRRLYVQLNAFGSCSNPQSLIPALEASGLEAVLYSDVNDPYGIGIVVLAESPDVFVTEARSLFATEAFASLNHKPKFTMLGRTYSSGYEPDLEDYLLNKPRRNSLNPDWPWAVWYPLRRKGNFAQADPDSQRKILMEHATIGRSYAGADLAYDIRLACYGLDENDNDFVIGLLGSELYPLSHVVQEMRKTQQTSMYIESLGPFFVGKAAWQSPMKG